MSHAPASVRPACWSDSFLLCSLGTNTWLRFRQCGIDFQRAQPPHRHQLAHITQRSAI